MRVAEDFRAEARVVLSGKWWIAVLVGFVASILGAVENGGLELKFTVDGGTADASVNFAGETIFSTTAGLNENLTALFVGGLAYVTIIVVIAGIAYYILSSIVTVGYARFNLNLVDRVEGSLNDLFAYFKYWKTTAMTTLLKSIYILLWTCLLVIPGVIASYSYAMTKYILADHPELTAGEAIARSKAMMQGNRMRLFCLQFSFIGWDILASFTLGIGNLWLIPYKEAATAVFYREVSGTEWKDAC